MPSVTRPAIEAMPVFAGHELAVAPTEFAIRPRTLKAIAQMSSGRSREFLRYAGDGREAVKRVREISVEWEHIAASRDVVDRILAQPGPHELVLWRWEQLAYRGDGSTVAFRLPWAQAIDTITPPHALPTSRFQLEARIGVNGTALTLTVQDDTTYDGGSPSAGHVWLREAGRDIKVGTAPAADEYLIVSIVPIYRVYESAETESRFRDPAREPRALTLIEEGAD